MVHVNQCVLDILEQIKNHPKQLDKQRLQQIAETLSQHSATALPALQDLLSAKTIEAPQASAIGNVIMVDTREQKPRIAITIAMVMTGADAKAAVKQAIVNEPSMMMQGNMLSDIVNTVEEAWFTDVLVELATEPDSPCKSTAQMYLRENPFYLNQIAERLKIDIQAAQTVDERRIILQNMAKTPTPAAVSTLVDLLYEAELRDEVLAIINAMRYTIASKKELQEMIHPHLLKLIEGCPDEELIGLLETAHNITSLGSSVENKHGTIRRVITLIYKRCVKLSRNISLSGDIQHRSLILLGNLLGSRQGALYQDEKDTILKTLNTAHDTTTSAETKTALADMLTRQGHAPHLRTAKCHICARSMPQSPLAVCEMCQKPACKSHMKDKHGVFCSEECLDRYRRENPQQYRERFF